MTSIKEDDLKPYRVRGMITILQMMTALALTGVGAELLLRWLF